MRIIIEVDDRERTPATVQQPTQPARPETLDGGPPPESLVRLMAAEASILPVTAETTQVTNAGAPSNTLLDVVRGASLVSLVGADRDSDAGPAPAPQP